MFCKKGVLRNFTKFAGKHLCQSLFFNKVAAPRPETLSKKRLWHRYFPVNFAKFLRAPIFTQHLWWLLLTSNKLRVMNIKNLLVDGRSIFYKELLKGDSVLMLRDLRPSLFNLRTEKAKRSI